VEEKSEEVMDYLQEVREELEIDELMKKGAREEKAMEEGLGEVNEATLRVAVRTMKDYFPSQSEPSGHEIRRIFQKAVEAASNRPGVKEANVWANNFEISEEMVRRDRATFSAVDGDLERFALQRMADNSSGRLSKESVERLHPSNPEREKLFELVGGMPVFLPEGFVSNGRIKLSFSSSYTSAGQAVNRMFMGIHDAGQAILLPYEEAVKIEGLHLATASRADKENKDSGRPIMDMTNVKGILKVGYGEV
jgi:hypothetical protein